MAKNKLFRTTMFGGFKKKNVISFLEILNHDHLEKVNELNRLIFTANACAKEKEEEYAVLLLKNNDLLDEIAQLKIASEQKPVETEIPQQITPLNDNIIALNNEIDGYKQDIDLFMERIDILTKTIDDQKSKIASLTADATKHSNSDYEKHELEKESLLSHIAELTALLQKREQDFLSQKQRLLTTISEHLQYKQKMEQKLHQLQLENQQQLKEKKKNH